MQHAIFRGKAGSGDLGWRWVHVEPSETVEAALLADEVLPRDVAWALLEHDTQPRARKIGDTVLLILRGMNELSGADPEDMISIRLAIQADRIISLERRRLRQIDNLVAAFERGEPPPTPGAFVLTLVESLREAAEPVLDAMEEQLVRLERLAIATGGSLAEEDRGALPNLRQDIIMIHRFIAPQAAAIHQLVRLKPDWLAEGHSMEEEAENFHRIAADLDSFRARAQVVAEQITLAATERTNRIVMLLSVVTVIFLPLTFLTGLLGVNLAGIPDASSPMSFLAFCGILVVVAGISTVLALRLMR